MGGGENLQECVGEAEALARANVRCIVDWSIEEDEDETSWDVNATRKAEVLRQAAQALGDKVTFMPLKLTALLSPALLEDITKELETDPDAVQKLHPKDQEKLREAILRLSSLCETARDCGVSLLVDAEQSNRQPAVHLVVRELQREFNKGQSVIYDTFQMYLCSGEGRLDDAMDAARAGGYVLAVKLVRGAYIQQEGPLGIVHPSKSQTDSAYNTAALKLLTAIAQQKADVSLMVATHNRRSLEETVAQMERLGLARGDHRIHFGQIMGMVDNLTFALGAAGYNATKLVVFGKLREVLPWLLRRVQENQDAFGAQALELPVYRSELWRRLTFRR